MPENFIDGDGSFAALVGSLPDIISRFDSSLRCTYTSPATERELGLSRAEVVGKTHREMGLPPEFCAHADAALRRVFDTAQKQSIEFDLPSPSGIRYFEAYAIPEIVRNGTVESVITVSRDITERKQTEAALLRRMRQAALGRDVGIALSESDSLPAILHRCAEAIVTHLDAAFARIWTFDGKENVLNLRASAGMYTHTDGAHGRVPLGMFKIGLIAQERKPHLTNSVVGDERVADQAWAVRESMVAFAGYPLIVEDRLVGVMGMFSRAPLAEDTLDALSSVANSIAQGIERKAAERERSQLREEMIAMQAARLKEMSTPLLPLGKHILIMPLVGSIDRVRAEQILATVSEGVRERNARIVLMDITGVPEMDAGVAAVLVQVAQTVHVLGAEAVVTGIRGRVARALVTLGVDLAHLTTRKTLADGLRYAEERLPEMGGR